MSKKSGQRKGTAARVAAPVGTTSVMRGRPPSVVTSSAGAIRVRHREFVRDVSAPMTGQFECYPLLLQPASEETFPWLSQIASSYERYRFRYCRFIYEPACPTVFLGSLLVGVDSDASDDPPHSKADMLAGQMTSMVSVWSPTVLEVPGKLLNAKPWYFTWGGTLDNEESAPNFHCGKILLATSGVYGDGITERVSLGSLFVEYDLELDTSQKEHIPEAVLALADVQTINTTGVELPLFYYEPDNMGYAGSMPVNYDNSTKVFTFNRQFAGLVEVAVKAAVLETYRLTAAFTHVVGAVFSDVVIATTAAAAGYVTFLLKGYVTGRPGNSFQIDYVVQPPNSPAPQLPNTTYATLSDTIFRMTPSRIQDPYPRDLSSRMSSKSLTPESPPAIRVASSSTGQYQVPVTKHN